MSQKQYQLAVVGATGLVGKELLEALDRRRFPIAGLRLFASLNSAGERVPFADDEIKIEPIRADFYQGCDLVFFATHPLVSRDLAESAAAAGALVIDASNAFRLDPQVPLVVPEVNPEALAPAARTKGIVASPSAAAVALALVTAPLQRQWGLARLVVTALYGSTAAGRLGFEEHQFQTIGIFNQEDMIIEKFPCQSAFNLFPRVAGFVNAVDDERERELMDELPRLLGREVPLAVTVAQAPLFCGLAAAVNFELERPASVAEVRDTLSNTAGLSLLDDPDNEVYPDTVQAMAHDEVLVGRLRPDPSRPSCFHLWLAADNLRKGSALNMVQIAELILKD
jgi:aspartate-semialdehyde dehydrogenase